MRNFIPKWAVAAFSILWLAVIIDREILEADSNQMGIKAPVVEAEIKNCTSTDVHQRYECTENAILANQRSTFVKAIGLGFLMFGPPIALWLLSGWLDRFSFGGGYKPDRRPPPISRWRVR